MILLLALLIFALSPPDKAAPTPVRRIDWSPLPCGHYSFKCCRRHLFEKKEIVFTTSNECSNMNCLYVNVNKFIHGEECCRPIKKPKERILQEYAAVEPCVLNETGTIDVKRTAHFKSPPVSNDQSHYPNLIECRWQWNFDKTYHVSLTFTNFSLEYDRNCLNDYVKMTFIKKSKTEESKRYCGTNKPHFSKKKAKQLEINFATDVADMEKGFFGKMKVLHSSNRTSTCAGTPSTASAPVNRSPTTTVSPTTETTTKAMTNVTTNVTTTIVSTSASTTAASSVTTPSTPTSTLAKTTNPASASGTPENASLTDRSKIVGEKAIKESKEQVSEPEVVRTTGSAYN